MSAKLPGNLLFMKVGIHAGESLEAILQRKQQEFRQAGVVFWGYGGSTCHPSRVQSFAKTKIGSGGEVYIAMERIISRHPPSPLIATEFSEDGIKWQSMPKGVVVRGSRYAVVLDEIQSGDLDINLSDYTVSVGLSRGKTASEYISGRVDKACISKNAISNNAVVLNTKKVEFFAPLKFPYAVFTR